MRGPGSRRSRWQSSGSIGRAVNVCRTSPERSRDESGVYRILALNGGIAPAPRSGEQCCSDRLSPPGDSGHCGEACSSAMRHGESRRILRSRQSFCRKFEMLTAVAFVLGGRHASEGVKRYSNQHHDPGLRGNRSHRIAIHIIEPGSAHRCGEARPQQKTSEPGHRFLPAAAV
jgi:hypothetical protein